MLALNSGKQRLSLPFGMQAQALYCCWGFRIGLSCDCHAPFSAAERRRGQPAVPFSRDARLESRGFQRHRVRRSTATTTRRLPQTVRILPPDNSANVHSPVAFALQNSRPTLIQSTSSCSRTVQRGSARPSRRWRSGECREERARQPGNGS